MTIASMKIRKDIEKGNTEEFHGGNVDDLLHLLARQVGVLTVSQRKRIKQLNQAKIKALGESLHRLRSRIDLARWLKNQ